MSLKRFDSLVGELKHTLAGLADKRTGENTQYAMETIGLSAFSVFFTQSPSWLAHQRAMEQNKGKSNAQTLFQVEKIPSDNHIRDMLDPVEPQAVYPVYDRVYEAFREQGILDTFRAVHDTELIALDGTWYFSSQSKNVHCKNCSTIQHKNGEFYNTGNQTILGDDLYAHQPFCRRVLRNNYHFIFVCKPDSHKHLYEWVDLLEPACAEHADRPNTGIHTVEIRVKNKKNQWEDHVYRYANNVPLVEGEGALKVNWCEVTITRKGKQTYHNAFITDWKITDKNVAGIVAAGRARWKIENENNNVLKNRGYHLKHNFGHGKEHLSSLLATLHTRQTFFDHIRCLTCYHCFPSWSAMMDFMMRGLEIGPYAVQEA